MIVSSKVPSGVHATPVLDYLTKRFTYFTRVQWQERLGNGQILTNGSVCDQARTLSGGDTIAYAMPDFEEPPADLSYEIVYEDEWILGVNKPPNLLVHRGGRSLKSNLIFHLRHVREPAYQNADIVNRLDRETSGIVIVAKDDATLRLLHAAFRAREVTKEYAALVYGIPEPANGVIDADIGAASLPGERIRFAVGGAKPKQALTAYKVTEHVGTEFSLVKLVPHTGRTHQLRVHMAHIGHPIVGDKIYGPAASCAQEGSVLFGRQALHCMRVEFMHPHTGQTTAIVAAIPADMKALIEKLRVS